MFCDGITKHDVLTYAALAARWKEPPKDALDTLVLNAIDLTPLDAYQQPEFLPFDPTIKRTEATLIGPDGTSFKVCS
jgi:H+-transporting ATPase